MNSFRLAPLAVLLVASLGTTGCGYHRYHARYPYMTMRARAYYLPQAAPPEAPPQVQEAPPPVEAAPAPAPAVYGGQQPIVVHSRGTTVIVINPPQGAPAVGIVQGQPPPMMAPQAAPAPRPQLPPQENPGGWGEGE